MSCSNNRQFTLSTPPVQGNFHWQKKKLKLCCFSDIHRCVGSCRPLLLLQKVHLGVYQYFKTTEKVGRERKDVSGFSQVWVCIFRVKIGSCVCSHLGLFVFENCFHIRHGYQWLQCGGSIDTRHKGLKKMMVYYSKSLSSAEKNFWTTWKGLLAVVKSS